MIKGGRQGDSSGGIGLVQRAVDAEEMESKGEDHFFQR